jgi:3-deoxy-D-manno-octulosonate 8-phosphate phosphatase KdsC-like HAD superfamily phosphatase
MAEDFIDKKNTKKILLIQPTLENQSKIIRRFLKENNVKDGFGLKVSAGIKKSCPIISPSKDEEIELEFAKIKIEDEFLP